VRPPAAAPSTDSLTDVWGPVSDPVVSNADLVVLLTAAAAEESDHRRLALERASRAARFWPQEAAELAEADTSLTSLTSVGPWVGAQIRAWLDDPTAVPEPDETRTGYLTLAEVRRTLADLPDWERTPHGDLQTHSTDSDGSLELADSAEAARLAGRTFVAATDHSQSLTIANGQDAERLLDQGRRIDAINAVYADAGESFRVLKSIEMDVFEDGSGDMDADVLAGLDLVLGAFHSKLRVKTDATDRYLAALGNPTVHVLAHPKARMYGRRSGLNADWPRVFDAAARVGKAVELDATPNRQDLNVELATIANAAGVRWFSMGTDAHSPGELKNLPFAMATAVQAGIARERFLNYRTADEVRDWARALGKR
jgi:histidinol phosphatase-like PHP family hydrolase